MKLLLDECIPRKLKHFLRDHECQTVPDAGFSGLKNGKLLASAEAAGFEILISMDKGLPFQQNLSGRRIAVLVLRAKSNRLADILPLLDLIVEGIISISPGELLVIELAT